MRKLNLTFLVVVACLFALAASAADVSGTYVAQVPGRNGTMETTFKLKADGDKLTGTVVTQRGEAEIKDGKVAGDTISFSQTFERGGNSMTILYKGKVEGNEIKFTREVQGGQGRTAEFTAKKQS
jgi:hypothetical protein